MICRRHDHSGRPVLTIDQLVAIADAREPVAFTADARARVRAARARRRCHAPTARSPAYGINTGFGSFADVRIPRDELAQLQLNLLRSHAAGVGEPLPVRAVRATMALRANVLAKGFSGIRVETLEALIDALNRGVHPRVPSRGSVGASGDLAPLAHLALVLIGEGEVWDGRETRSRETRRWTRAGIEPVVLGPKEGLALINGTQASTAVARAGAGRRRAARACGGRRRGDVDRCAAGSVRPFERRIHEARPFAGQRASRPTSTRLIAGSGINRLARQLRAGAGCLFDAVCASGPRRGARRAHLRRRRHPTSR